MILERKTVFLRDFEGLCYRNPSVVLPNFTISESVALKHRILVQKAVKMEHQTWKNQHDVPIMKKSENFKAYEERLDEWLSWNSSLKPHQIVPYITQLGLSANDRIRRKARQLMRKNREKWCPRTLEPSGLTSPTAEQLVENEVKRLKGYKVFIEDMKNALKITAVGPTAVRLWDFQKMERNNTESYADFVDKFEDAMTELQQDGENFTDRQCITTLLMGLRLTEDETTSLQNNFPLKKPEDPGYKIDAFIEKIDEILIPDARGGARRGKKPVTESRAHYGEGEWQAEDDWSEDWYSQGYWSYFENPENYGENDENSEETMEVPEADTDLTDVSNTELTAMVRSYRTYIRNRNKGRQKGGKWKGNNFGHLQRKGFYPTYSGWRWNPPGKGKFGWQKGKNGKGKGKNGKGKGGKSYGKGGKSYGQGKSGKPYVFSPNYYAGWDDWDENDYGFFDEGCDGDGEEWGDENDEE